MHLLPFFLPFNKAVIYFFVYLNTEIKYIVLLGGERSRSFSASIRALTF